MQSHNRSSIKFYFIDSSVCTLYLYPRSISAISNANKNVVSVWHGYTRNVQVSGHYRLHPHEIVDNWILLLFFPPTNGGSTNKFLDLVADRKTVLYRKQSSTRRFWPNKRNASYYKPVGHTCMTLDVNNYLCTSAA